MKCRNCKLAYARRSQTLCDGCLEREHNGRRIEALRTESPNDPFIRARERVIATLIERFDDNKPLFTTRHSTARQFLEAERMPA